MRIGVAGVGRIGAVHVSTLRQISEIDAVVVVDAAPGRAHRLAGELTGVEVAPSIEAMFAADIAGLVIATPTDTHATLILSAVEAGLPVFCEKPVAADAAGTRAVLNKVAGAGSQVHVGFQRRFDTGYATARAAVASGALGWLHTVRAATYDPAPPPASYIAGSGGLFKDCSVHDFDALRWVTGREVAQVYAIGANRGDTFVSDAGFLDAGDVDTAAALLTLDDGTLALVGAGRYNGAGYDVRMEVHGSAGTVAVGVDDRLPLRSAETDVGFPGGPPWSGFVDRFQQAYRDELAAFVDMVAGRAASPCTVEDALAALVIAEACECSRRQGRPVRIEEMAQ